LDALSDEKVAKIKKFCKDYIARVLRKLEKSDRKFGSSSNGCGHYGTPSTLTATPNSGHGDADRETMEMSVEEALEKEGEEDGGYGSDDPHNHDPYSPDFVGGKSSPPSSVAPTPSTSRISTSNVCCDKEKIDRRWDDWNQDRMGPDQLIRDFESNWS
jgi:histone-lysine N-methyltransferase SETD2